MDAYRITDGNERYFGTSTARLAVGQFGGCFVVQRDDVAVTLVERDGGRIQTTRV